MDKGILTGGKRGRQTDKHQDTWQAVRHIHQQQRDIQAYTSTQGQIDPPKYTDKCLEGLKDRQTDRHMETKTHGQAFTYTKILTFTYTFTYGYIWDACRDSGYFSVFKVCFVYFKVS